MNEEKKEIIDLTQLSPKEELTKIAEICEKLNYIFEKTDLDSDKKEEEPLLKK